MKWSILILLVLGLVAALCAALLMGTLSIKPPREKEPEKIEVAMAKRPMNMSTVITREDIEIEMVSKDEIPTNGKIVRPLQVIGRVLGLPVVEGQVLTESCLVPEGTGAILASQIPKGMRAFSVPITSRARPDNILLYPGCIVDVLVEYKLPGSKSGPEALSSTMFRELQVLAISGNSVVNNPDDEDGNGKRGSSRGGLTVSLLVEPKQVEALQLATENGRITMSLRNPLDKKTFVQEGSVLNRSTLIKSGTTVGSTVLSTSQDEYELFAMGQFFDANEPQGQRITPYNPAQERIFDTKGSASNPTLRSRWQVETILGREKKLDEFPAPEDKTEDTDTKK